MRSINTRLFRIKVAYEVLGLLRNHDFIAVATEFEDSLRSVYYSHQNASIDMNNSYLNDCCCNRQ